MNKKNSLKKRVLFFLAHPAHYHLFKNVIQQLNLLGYENLIVIKEKDILSNLLKNNNIPYVCIQKDENVRRKNSYISILFHAAISLIKRNIKLLMLVLAKRPDLLIGSETSITHIGALLRIPSIVTNEDDWQLQKEFVYPRTTKSWIKKNSLNSLTHSTKYLKR